MVMSSNLMASGKQRALCHSHRTLSWTLWWLGHLWTNLGNQGNPMCHWLRPMICSTDHGGKPGGINLIALDQSGSIPVAVCVWRGERECHPKRMAVTQGERGSMESWWPTPYLQMRRTKREAGHVRTLCQLRFSWLDSHASLFFLLFAHFSERWVHLTAFLDNFYEKCMCS